MSALAQRSWRGRLAGFSWMFVLAMAAALSAGATAGPHAGIRRVVEHGGSGTFHCALRKKTVRGLCMVSHERVVTRDPDLIGLYGNGGSTATLDAIVIRWPSGKVMRVVEGDDWEWADLERPTESAYHSAMYWDGKGVRWSRGFVLLDDEWKELIRVW